MRLNRFLAAAGQGSRRSCEELIRDGHVTVNGALCTNLSTQVLPTDTVKVGNRVMHVAASVTVLLNKPAGFLCTASDTHQRRTIFDLLPPNFPRLFHVGRLDKESEGLLILTNDGQLSLKLTHPRFKVEKEYEVVLDKPFDFALSEKLLHGMSLAEGWAKAEGVHRLANNKLKVVLKQGLKRQIRQMFYTLGYEVIKLTRTRIGPIRIEHIPTGHWRVLTQKEIEALLAGGGGNEVDSGEDRKPRKNVREAVERGEAARPKRPFSPARNRSPRDDGRSSRRPAEETKPFRSGNSFSKASRPSRSTSAQGRYRDTSEKVEEIPFVPRAQRAAQGREAGRGGSRGASAGGSLKSQSGRRAFGAVEGTSSSRSGRSAGRKPSGGKAFGSKHADSKAGSKSAAKAPHGFSKFMKR